MSPLQYATMQELLGRIPDFARKVGMPADMLKNIQFEFADLTGLAVDQENSSKKAHEKTSGKDFTVTDILGAIQFNGLNAVVQLSNKLEHLDQLEGAVYHELYHAMEKWMQIPADTMLKMLQHTPNFEDRAIKFSEYMVANKFEKGTPSWLRAHWLQLRRFLQLVSNFLRGKGFFRPEDMYGRFITGAFLPRLALPAPAFLTDPALVSSSETAFMLLGKKSLTRDKKRLAYAAGLYRNNVDMKKIRLETGWFLGPDKMWRYEMNDIPLKIDRETLKKLQADFVQGLTRGVQPLPISLEDIIEHDELLHAYPELRKAGFALTASYSSYNEETGFLQLNYTASENLAKAREDMIHELQHAVQGIEGFARGGNVKEFINLNEFFETQLRIVRNYIMDNSPKHEWNLYLRGEKKDRKWRVNNVITGKFVNESKIPAKMQKMVDSITEAYTKIQALSATPEGEDKLTSTGQYMRLLGEAEARDSSTRASFDDLSRAAIEPYWTQGIPNDEFIIRFKSGTGSVLSTDTTIDTSEEVLFSVARNIQRSDTKERGLLAPLKKLYVDKIGTPLWDYFAEDLPIRLSKRSTLINRIAKGLVLDFGKDEGFIEERDNTNARITHLTEKAKRMSEELNKLTSAEQVRASQIIQGSVTVQSEKYKAAIEASKAFQRLYGELSKLGILGPDNRFRKLTRKEVATKMKEIGQYDKILEELERSLTPQVYTSRTVNAATEEIVEELVMAEEVVVLGEAQATVTRITEANEKRVKEALTSRGFAKGESNLMIQHIKDSVMFLENSTGPIAQIKSIVSKTIRSTLSETITKEFKYDSRTMREARASIRKRIRTNMDARNALMERVQTHWKESGKSYLRRAYAKIEEEKRFKKSLMSWIFRRNRLTNKGYSKQRKNLTAEYRKSLGEIRQAPFLVMKGLSEESHDAEMMRLFTVIASNPKWAVERKDLDREGVHKGWKPLSGSVKLGPLANMFVDEFIWDDLNEAVRERSDFIRQWDKILSLWKLGKVPFNPATQIRNIITNFGLADFGNLNPHRLDIYIEAAIDFWNKKGYWKEAMTTTLLGDEWAGAEVFKFLDDVSRLEKGGTMLTKGTKALMKILDKPSETYQGIEQFFKLAVFISERKAGRSIKQSATHAEKFLFNYTKIPPWIRAAKRWYAPFITFSYKAMPRVAETAIKRPWKMAKYLIILSAIEAITRRLYGESEEEEKREKAVLPDYMRKTVLPGPLKHIVPGLLSHIRVPYRDQYGRSKYWDLSYILPWGDVAEQWGQSQIPFRPFLPSHPVFSVFDIAYNEVMFNGRELTIQDVDEGSDYWKKIGTQLWLQAAPALLSHSYTRFTRALYGEVDYMGRERSMTEAVFDVFFGIKMRSIDYTESRGRHLRKLTRAIANIKQEFKRDYQKLILNPSSNTEKQQRRYEDLFKRLNRKLERITDKILEVDNPK
ncbi:hypothetical protein LCGC14_1143690 [marine sediment metagenome]|uniref:Large polyvalent protein associated domain-containing protein n=1 Tax=marine sediment metagenome TaxID=412755 RepID=A0A0F9Q3A2_9ZZZZ